MSPLTTPVFLSRTFLAANASYAEGGAVIIGSPLDVTASFRPGARFAPQAIRDCSWGLEGYSPRLDRDLEEIKLCDVGDLTLPQGDLRGALALIEAYVCQVLADGKLPIILGGEHLISLAAVRGMLKYYPELVVVQLDAHADLRDEYLGERLSHATVMRRIADILSEGRVFQLGIRSGTRGEWEMARAMGSLRNVEEVVRQVTGHPVYLTVDLDVLDPAVAPGVGVPEPGGMTFAECLSLIEELRALDVVGFDLVELTPPFDPTQQSAMAAAKLLRELILQFPPAPEGR